MANLTHVELITPERVLFSGEAEAVIMRTDGGDITFLANHMDYIAAVDICVLRLEGARHGGAHDAAAPLGSDSEEPASGEPAPTREIRAAVHGGFVMVADNKVTVATGVAELAEDIDVARAERALEQAEAAGALAGPAASAGSSGEELESGDDVSSTGRTAAELAAARARTRLEAAGQLQGSLSPT